MTMTPAEIVERFRTLQAQAKRANDRVTEALHMFDHPQRKAFIATEQACRAISEDLAQDFFDEHRAIIEDAR